MGNSTEIPNWVLISIVAPLIVASLLSGVGAIITVSIVKSTVADLKENAVTRTYVDNRYDRLQDLIEYRIENVKQSQKQMHGAIKTNRARSIDNADRIAPLELARRTQSAWHPWPPVPQTLLAAFPAIYDRGAALTFARPM